MTSTIRQRGTDPGRPATVTPPDTGFERLLASALPADALRHALDHARTESIPIADAVVALGLMTEAQAYRALAEWAERPFVDLEATPPQPEAARLLPERVARARGILAVAQDNRTLTYVSPLPFDVDVDQDVAFASGRRPRLAIAMRSQVTLALNRVYRQSGEIETILDRIRHASAAEPVEAEAATTPGDSPVIDLCNRILGAAISAGASDIHIEPSGHGGVVRRRVCGILEPLITLPASAIGRVTNRFKIMAKADIATRNKPQDGAFRVTLDGGTVDVRLSVLPTINGEKIVMRVIHAATSQQTLEALGYDAQSLERLRGALARPDGLVLVTGPTGSGKTTVLYAALQHLLGRSVNIVTVEDPVERQVEGVTQTAVNTKSGMSFAAVLRSVMRQDPNIIMVGEIRDAEVADIVGQAAYTGHLVLSSLHTIDAASAITRLLNLGLAPFKVAESLHAVVAQRLLRKLCPHCRVVHADDAARRLGAAHGVERIGASIGPGCPRCKHSGYLDRIVVPEVLVPDDALREAIRDGASAHGIRTAMHRLGCPLMYESALQLVVGGTTSIDEVNRVLDSRLEDASGAESPCAAVTAMAPAVAKPAAAWPRSADARRVLVTDDDRMIRMLVRLLLQKDGFEVLEAENGAVGLDLARRERPDLMIVDLQMPDMNGFEAIERVRGDLAIAAMPVIVLTSETGRDVEARVLEMGADDYLMKPFEPEVLTSRVRAAFRRLARAAA